MAKKSFKGANPAMQFINASIEEAAPEPIVTPPVRTVQAPRAVAAPRVVKEPPVEVDEPDAMSVPSVASEPNAPVTPAVTASSVWTSSVEASPVEASHAAASSIDASSVEASSVEASPVEASSVEASSAATHVVTDSAAREAAQARRTADERKSKRLNLLIQPSIMEDLSKVSHMKQKSVNDLINIVLREYCGNKRELIEKYDTIFGE